MLARVSAGFWRDCAFSGKAAILSMKDDAPKDRSKDRDTQMSPPHDNAWEAWTPAQLWRRLQGLAIDWYVVGGWALDLHLGVQSRAHDDLEFAVSPQGACRVAERLGELAFFAVRQGKFTPWSEADPIPDDLWQIWGADPESGVWRVDMMMERGTRERWVYKRNATIGQPRSEAIRTTAQGIRYLAPANVLLFKAKHHRPKDEQDFQAALPGLTQKEREDLACWLDITHPGHVWIEALRY
jgi:hypothetical protein